VLGRYSKNLNIKPKYHVKYLKINDIQGDILIIKFQGYEIWTCNIMLLMFPFVLLLLCNKILEFCYLGYVIVAHIRVQSC